MNTTKKKKKFDVYNVIFIWVVVSFVAVISYAFYVDKKNEERYQRDTSVEVKAEHERVANEIGTLKRGDFVVLENGTTYFVEWSSAPEMRARTADTLQAANIRILTINRRVLRIVRSSDPGWAEVVKQYLDVTQ